METVDSAALDALLERSRSVRAESQRIGARLAEVHEHVSGERRRSLTEATALTDGPEGGTAVMLDRLDRLSSRIGRSPDIERAKTILGERYGISRGEAFAILRSVSSHSNRKLRDVAREIAAGSADGNRATLNPSG